MSKKTWKIWIKTFNSKGELCGAGVSTVEYKYRGNAVRAAKKSFKNCPYVQYTISQDNPFIF